MHLLMQIKINQSYLNVMMYKIE